MEMNLARQGVTLDEVSAAASTLQDEGKPVTIDAVRESLGAGSPNTIHKHLVAWRANNATPSEAPKAEIPASLAAAMASWAAEYAESAGAGVREALSQSESDMEALLKAGEELEAGRDELLATVADITTARDQALAAIAERDEEIQRLTVELRNAKQVAMEALVGKAKDQLAIEGKDAQLADLRVQIERNVAASAKESDARLAAEMELVGAATARDSLAAEINDLRKQLEALRAKG